LRLKEVELIGSFVVKSSEFTTVFKNCRIDAAQRHYRAAISHYQQPAEDRLAAVVLRRLWTRMSTTFRSVNGAAKIVLLAADPDEHLVRVPRAARLWAAELQHIGEDPAEVQAPLADALVADEDPRAASISWAQTEAVIKATRHANREGQVVHRRRWWGKFSAPAPRAEDAVAPFGRVGTQQSRLAQWHNDAYDDLHRLQFYPCNGRGT
jgi:hypothetical protein